MKQMIIRSRFKTILGGILFFAMLLSQTTGALTDASGQIGSYYEASQVNGNKTNQAITQTEISAEQDRVRINKTVAATDKENVFDITLSVSTQDDIRTMLKSPNAATVIVIDTSTSMNNKLSGNTSRLAAAQTAAQTFINNFARTSGQGVTRKIAIVGFCKDAKILKGWTDATELDTASNTTYTTVINDLKDKLGSGTNIEGGLLLARNLLSSSAIAGIDNLNVILLSDGAPNACVVGTHELAKYDINYPNNDLIGTDQTNTSLTEYTGYYNNADYHFHHGGAMEAANLIKANAKLYAVFCGDPNEQLTCHDGAANGKLASAKSCDYCKRAQECFDGKKEDYKVSEFLELAIAPGAYLDAEDADSLSDAFVAIETQISIATQAWKVTDPIGDDKISHVSHASNPAVSFNQGTNTLRWDLLKDQPKEENNRYVYSTTYQVRLDTLHDDYVAGTEYLTNDPTVLDYYFIQENTNSEIEQVYFNHPTVKGFDADISFKKTDENGNALAGATFTLNTGSWSKQAVSDANGTVKFEDVPSGHTYTITETSAPNGYVKWDGNKQVAVSYGEITTDGFSSFVVENESTTTDVPVSKVWVDAENQAGIRPASVTVKLLANGTQVDSVALNEGNKWTHTFTNLAKKANGTAIAYTIEEVEVEGYASVITGSAADGYTVTNTYTPVKTSVSVNKVWDDAGNQDGIRPASVTVNLLANGQDTGKTVTLNASNNWASAFTDLLKNANGTAIAYTIEEVTTPVITGTNGTGTYAISISGDATTGYTVTNTHTPNKTSVRVSKVWNDEDNRDGIRPSSVTVKLLANGQDTGKTVTLDASNNWAAAFTDLAEKANGTAIAYTIEEVTTGVVTGTNGAGTYAISITGSAAEGFTITNTHTPGKTSVRVSKVWDDANNQDGIRPASVTVKLLANGQDTGKTVTLDASNNWAAAFTDLAEKANGAAITYTIEEVTTGVITGTNGAGTYAISITGSAAEGFIVTNTHTPGKTSVPVSKVWDDANNQDGIRPASVTVKLLANGQDTGKTVTLNASNNWAAAFTDLAEKANGAAITYTIEEVQVEGYVSGIAGDAKDGFVITNKHTPGKTNVSVRKVWDDENNQDGIRPASVTVKLLANDQDTGKTVTLDASNNWAAAFTDLAESANGAAITYTIEEVQVEGYVSGITGNAKDGFIITNTHTPGKTSVPVSKVWDDENNKDGIRPKSITVKLLADGADTGLTMDLTEESGWKGAFTELDENKDGEAISYSIEEVSVEGYATQITTDETGGYVITNTHETEVTSVPVVKVWNDGYDVEGLRPEKITVKLYADGFPVEGKTLELSEENGWAARFDNLPKNKAGKEIFYTVDEVDCPAGYTYEITLDKETGLFTITNSHEVVMPELPETGDSQNLLLWIGMLLTSAAAFFFFRKRKHS